MDDEESTQNSKAAGWEQWSELGPSFPELVTRSRQMVSAFSRLGESTGDFILLRLLGEGAFGKVFLAKQQSLDREVALKITANFGHEARTMARLEHSHIVQVFAESVDPEKDIRLLCMQYVPGATLQQIIQELRKRPTPERNGQAILEIVDASSAHPTTLDPARLRYREILTHCDMDEAVCWIGQQLAEALAYAHGRGVLHRDIKPANVIANQYGQPMLTDFSISLPTTNLTDIGVAMFGGTLGYMAPEHINALDPNHPGGPDSVRETSDIFALGAVLCDLLTGVPRLSTSANTLDSHSLNQLATEHNNSLQHESLLRQRDVSHALARVICHCLEVESENRFQSAQEFAQALSGCLELLRVKKMLPPSGFLTLWARKQPLLFILLLTCVPNIAASVANLTYNAQVVINELSAVQQAAFGRMVFWYNIAVISVLAIMLYRTLFAAALKWREFNRDPLRPSVDVEDTRRRALSLPFWTLVLGSVGWLPFALTIPLGMEVLSGPVDRGAMLHISVAFLVTGLIAIVANYYVVGFAVLRGMYTSLWDNAFGLRETAARELAGIVRWNRICQVVAGLTPLGAATLLVLVGPEQFTAHSFDRFQGAVVILIGMGIAGFWLAMTATAYLNSVVSVITSASRD